MLKDTCHNQIMQVCQSKAHNTFTNCYQKDLTWSDNDNMYLGPVVAAQQVLDSNPLRLVFLRKKRGGGGGGGVHPLQLSLQEFEYQGLGYNMSPLQDEWEGLLSFISVFTCIKDLSKCSHNLIIRVAS